MGRQCTDGAEELFLAVHPHPARRQNTGIHAPHLSQANAAVLFHSGNHQANLIHVSAKHHLGACSLFMGNHIEHRVDANFIHIGAKLLGKVCGNLRLLTAWAYQCRRLRQDLLHVHVVASFDSFHAEL